MKAKKAPIRPPQMPIEPGAEATQPAPESGSSRARFPIIGIGTSAGGLEALELFLKNVPLASGMAFVIVQHLDPTHKGMLVELLQRATTMPVIQVHDQLVVEPDRVYVIPPNKDMSLLHGILHLLPPAAPRGLRLPIDFFFRSIADDCQERGVGVILSGMGSDGTLGLRAIKEKAGTAFVQDPANAQFDGMPRSAIDAGLADVVAAVDELPGKIQAFLQHAQSIANSDLPAETQTRGGLDKLIILLRAQTGHDFSLYKKSTISRRVERRMGLHQIDRIAAYVRLLQENPQETQLLFNELLIGVTNFFRDPAAWEKMKNEVFPALLAAYPRGMVLRAWTPGCSTGEEAYSLAICFKEALADIKPAATYSLQIFATDLDRDAVDKARRGSYPANIAADVSAERLSRFFVLEENGGYRVNKEIREMVVFAPQNLVMDAPFTRLDLLVCRNLLIYLEAELQKKLLPLFHYALNPGGMLFLGSAETIGTFGSLFSPLDSRLRIYRRMEGGSQLNPLNYPTAFHPPASGTNPAEPPARPPLPAPNLASLMEQLILTQFSPAAVLTNGKGDILYISGRTGKYLEPASGKANLNIFAMAREGLQLELTSAFQKAIREKSAVTLKNLTIGSNGGTQVIHLTVQPIEEPAGLRGLMLVVFHDVAALRTSYTSRKAQRNAHGDGQSKQWEIDLQSAREELLNTREEMQTSQEELKSINEELQSTNEELQSTNEELTTSKEEMQSLNEELQTVNHELQARVDELSHANNDMKNLLDSTHIATLFLDDALRVRRFTSQASKLIRLIPGDAGRLITDIASELIYPELGEDVQEVLRSLIFKEKAVVTRDGSWFSVRVMPYRTLDNRIDGVVITFADISAAKKLESALRESEQETLALFKLLPTPFALFEAVLDGEGVFSDCLLIYVNDAFERALGIEHARARGRRLVDLWPGINPDWIRVFGAAAASGDPSSIRLTHSPSGKTFDCTVYRPGDSPARLCVNMIAA